MMLVSYLLFSMPIAILLLPIRRYYCVRNEHSIHIGSGKLARAEGFHGKQEEIHGDIEEKSIDRTTKVTDKPIKPSFDYRSGIEISANLNAHERTQGSVMRTLAEDDSQVSVTAAMKRFQSNDVLEESSAEVLSIVVIPIVQGK